MRATIALAVAFAAGVIAKPIHKRDEEIDTVTDVTETVVTVYTTVYGPSPNAALASSSVVASSSAADAHTWTHWSHHSWTRSFTQAPASSSVASSAPAPPPPASTPVASSTSAPAPPPPSSTPSSTVVAPVTTEAPSSSSAAAPSSSAAATLSGIAQQAVDLHNKHRSNHTDTPPIEWDQDLADAAETVAKQCSWSHITSANNLTFGQNYGASPTGATIGDAIEMWYSETSLFLPSYYGALSPTDRGCSESGSCPEYGHFTQLIWKGTTKIGCFIADCSGGYSLNAEETSQGQSPPDGKADPVFQVCNYSPAGNVNAEIPSNPSPSDTAWASSVGYPANVLKPTGTA
ncbi:MAG: hypothetical protein M1820_005251 [Bogoriella megaspora]|nr:MAG: hypothetical protein M1820_005251 [Bogoriella megaspora]